MISLDRDALICDMAEEYHIYDMRSLPARLVATLAVGLRENSRIRKKARGRDYSREDILLAQVHDRIAAVVWLLGGYGDAEQPPSLVDAIVNGTSVNEGEFKKYSTAEEFDTAWHS